MQVALEKSALATADVNGNISFTLPPVRNHKVWTGSIIVSSTTGLSIASSNVLPIQWTALDASNIISKWFNDLPSTTMQARSQAIIKGSNIGNTEQLKATFFGVETDLDDTPISWPTPPPAPPAIAPKTIVSNNVSLGIGTTQIGNIQPVLVGTSIEIFECLTAHQGAGSNVRLAIQWSIDGTFVDPVEYDFDLASAVNMRGLILPNLAPFIRFLAITGSGQEQISLTAFTGLSTIVRPPIVLGGILASNTGPFAAGNTSFVLPPYTGPAMLSGEMIGAAGKFEMSMNAASYLNFSAGSQFVIDSMIDPNGVRIIPPTQVFIPPYICTLIVTNGNGVSEAGDFQLVAAP